MPKVRGLGEKSLRFYTDVLGLEVMSPPDFRGARFLRAGAPAYHQTPAATRARLTALTEAAT